jgi:hypothetical protein
MRRSWPVAALIFFAFRFASAPAAAQESVPWLGLTGAQRDEILQQLEAELNDYRQGIVSARAEEEQQQKTLAELLADLRQPGKPWLPKYTQKYAELAYQGLRSNPRDFAEIAGEASAGNYDRLANELPKWGAGLFAQMVSDGLGEFEFEQSKVVWDALVSRAGDLQAVGVAFMRGEWGAMTARLGELARKEGERASKEAIATVINWVLEPVGQFGETYVKVLEAEAEFLKWSRRNVASMMSQPCLDRYEQIYDRLTREGTAHAAAIGEAYERFRDCSIVRPFEFSQVEEHIREAGLDPRQVYIAMLEAYRNRGTRPAQWLADELERRKAQAEAQLQVGFVKVQAELDQAGRLFHAALRARLNQLIAEEAGRRGAGEARGSGASGAGGHAA